MSDLTYKPTPPPARPFRKGDRVESLDREGVAMGEHLVTSVRAGVVRTDCGRSWAVDGQWFDGSVAWPFPSIRLAEV
jgi:hypothetical protein